MCVEDQGAEAIVLCDVGGDVDGTLVAKVAAELEVVEGEGVVGGFGPVSMLAQDSKRGVLDQPRREDIAI
jgi:hypothetical protein